MNSTHHELSFELLHVGWHSNLQNFEFWLMSGTALSLGALTQQLARIGRLETNLDPASQLRVFSALQRRVDRATTRL